MVFVYAIVKNQNGTFYTSPVFAYYCRITSTNEYQKYLDSIYNRFYVVLNQDKTRLIKQYVFDRSSQYLQPRIHIVEAQTDGWKVDADGHGCVAYLDTVDFFADPLEIEPTLLKKCIRIGKETQYKEYVDIETNEDIENFRYVSGGMHDAFIETAEQKDDTLYVLFDGSWGAKIEVWFIGDISYSIRARQAERSDPYWMASTFRRENGYFYLIDGADMEVDDISDDFCWFKAKNVRYRVLPK